MKNLNIDESKINKDTSINMKAENIEKELNSNIDSTSKKEVKTNSTDIDSELKANIITKHREGVKRPGKKRLSKKAKNKKRTRPADRKIIKRQIYQNTNKSYKPTPEQFRTMLKRLENLHDDLFEDTLIINDFPVSVNKLINGAYDEILDDFVRDYSPVNSSRLEIYPQTSNPFDKPMLDFSEYYESFKEKIKIEYTKLIVRRTEAADLISKILTLPEEYSIVLFYRYYLLYTVEQTSIILYVGTSTYYRMKKTAINMLCKIYYS